MNDFEVIGQKKSVESVVNQAIDTNIKYTRALNTIKTFKLIYFITAC